MSTLHETKTPEQSSQTNATTPEQTKKETTKNPGKDALHEQRQQPPHREGALGDEVPRSVH